MSREPICVRSDSRCTRRIVDRGERVRALRDEAPVVLFVR
jgi:hypothetical protein